MISVFYLLLLVLFALNLSFNAVAIILHDVVATAPVVLKRRLPVFVAVPPLSISWWGVPSSSPPPPLLQDWKCGTDGLVSHPVLKPKPAPKLPRQASTTVTPRVPTKYDSGLSSIIWPWPPIPPRTPTPPHEQMRTRALDDDTHRLGLNASIWAPKNERPPRRPETPARPTPDDDAGRPGLNASMWAPARVLPRRPQPKVMLRPIAAVPRTVIPSQFTANDDDRRAGLTESIWAPNRVVAHRPALAQAPPPPRPHRPTASSGAL
ncbi:hypothetical protein C8J57DRAFT_1562313 [Mycena rebaudengoi]|nr:hypothetical protein C8J57DRAFT_1562313 [Mycena rebaudengoi]